MHLAVTPAPSNKFNLLQFSCKDLLFVDICNHAHLSTINEFLECADKIDFNAKDQLGRTVLLAACNWTQALPGYRHKHRDPKVPGPVIRLLDGGADITALDNEGRHALHHLLDNSEIEQDTIFQFLSREACKVLLNQKDNKGFSLLHCALRTLRPPVCEALIALSCNLLEPDPTGTTALQSPPSAPAQTLTRKQKPRASTRLPRRLLAALKKKKKIPRSRRRH